MPNYCVAVGCKNTAKKGSEYSFHHFPHQNPNLLKKWVHAIRRKQWKPTKHSFICSDHFNSNQCQYQQQNGRTCSSPASTTGDGKWSSMLCICLWLHVISCFTIVKVEATAETACSRKVFQGECHKYWIRWENGECYQCKVFYSCLPVCVILKYYLRFFVVFENKNDGFPSKDHFKRRK